MFVIQREFFFVQLHLGLFVALFKMDIAIGGGVIQPDIEIVCGGRKDRIAGLNHCVEIVARS